MEKNCHLGIGFFAISLAFCFGIIGWALQDKFQPTKLEIPNAHWEKIFFRGINDVTKLSGLEELRKTNHFTNDLEIRIWRVSDEAEAIIIKRIGETWSAIYIKSDSYTESTESTVTKLNAPKSGWNSLWNKIEASGVLTLPDASQINCSVAQIDGMGYVVETSYQKKYRTYMYSMSSLKCDEAKKLERIGDIITEEFDDGKGVCKRTEWIPCARLNRERLKNKQ